MQLTDRITITTSIAKNIAVYTSPTDCDDLTERACQINTTEIQIFYFQQEIEFSL